MFQSSELNILLCVRENFYDFKYLSEKTKQKAEKVVHKNENLLIIDEHKEKP